MSKREKLAAYAHFTWARWMKYLFENSINNNNGTVTIPKWAVDKWIRQMSTSYNNLSEKEKESDRMEADKILEIIGN